VTKQQRAEALMRQGPIQNVRRIMELEDAREWDAHALRGFLWLDNNSHNYGATDWLVLFEAAVEDARAALARELRPVLLAEQ
jgi:hypothetical protein